MASAYDGLLETGAISSLKREILLEASVDLYYLAHIRRWFAEWGGAQAVTEATDCTVRIITELVAKDLCHLATWGEEKGSFQTVTLSDDKLTQLVDGYGSFDTMPFDYFLITTQAGNDWVARYRTLADEL